MIFIDLSGLDADCFGFVLFGLAPSPASEFWRVLRSFLSTSVSLFGVCFFWDYMSNVSLFCLASWIVFGISGVFDYLSIIC